MKDKKLLFDRKCHVLYSQALQEGDTGENRPALSCGRAGAIWEQVQRQYAEFLSDWRTDLGGKRNFHNGVGGTYDCIAIMSYYTSARPSHPSARSRRWRKI